MIHRFFLSLTATAALILSGCGFTPLHTAASAGGAPLANVDIQLKDGASVVADQAGFFVTQRLNDRIGTQSDKARFALEITPVYRRRRFGLTDADIASRYDVTVAARWKLVNQKTGRVMRRGNTTTTTTFGAPDGPYGVITADNVGVEQAAGETADKLILELAKFFANRNQT